MSSINVAVLFDINALGSSYRKSALRILMSSIDPMKLCGVRIYEGDVKYSSGEKANIWCFAIQEENESTGGKRSEYFKSQVLKLNQNGLLPKDNRIVTNSSPFNLQLTGRIDHEGKWRSSGWAGEYGDMEAAQVGLEWSWKVLPENDDLGSFAIVASRKFEGKGTPWSEDDKLILISILKEFGPKLTSTAVKNTRLSTRDIKQVEETLQKYVWSKTLILKKSPPLDNERFKELYEFATRSKYGSNPGLGMYDNTKAHNWATKMIQIKLDTESIEKRYKNLYDFAKRSEYDLKPGLGMNEDKAEDWATKMMDSALDIETLMAKEVSRAFWDGFWSENAFYGLLIGSAAGLLMSLFLFMRNSPSSVWRALGFWTFFTLAEFVILGFGIIFIINFDKKGVEKGESYGFIFSALSSAVICLSLAIAIFPSLGRALVSVLTGIIGV